MATPPDERGGWLRAAARPLYNLVRKRLPRDVRVLNGVAVRRGRWLDLSDTAPEFKSGYINAIRNLIEQGDTVVEVGVGWGVSSVWAARQVGNDGRVVAYEASDIMTVRAQETLMLNRVSDRVDVRHGIVGTAGTVFGDDATVGEVVSVDALPECDVVLLDCEGAEADIVPALCERGFETLIVETHEFRRSDAGPDALREVAADHGYEVRENGEAAPGSDSYRPILVLNS